MFGFLAQLISKGFLFFALHIRNPGSFPPALSAKEERKQLERYKNEGIQFNSQLTAPLIEKYCILGQKEQEMLKTAFDKLSLSARGYHKILKTARTVADLEGSKNIELKHLLEVIQYRSLDRKYMM